MRYLPLLLMLCLLFSCSSTTEDKSTFDRTKVEYVLSNDGRFLITVKPSQIRFRHETYGVQVRVRHIDEQSKWAYIHAFDNTGVDIDCSISQDSLLRSLDRSTWVVSVNTEKGKYSIYSMIDANSNGDVLREVMLAEEPLHETRSIDEPWIKNLWHDLHTSISVTHQDSVLYMRMYEYKMLKDSLNVSDSDVTVLREVNI